MLTAEQMLAAKDFREEVVAVPEWGGEVKVRTLSMGARYAINDRALKVVGNDRRLDNRIFAAATLEHGLVEPRLDAKQAEALMDKSPEPVERIIAAIWRISGLEADAAKNASSAA